MRVLIGLVLLAAISGVTVGFFGDVWLPFDAVSHFRLHFSGLISVCLVSLFVRRWRFVTFVVGALAVPFVISFAPYQLIDEKASASAVKSFKLLSFNTWHRKRDLRSLERYIAQVDADFVMLIEFGASKRPLLRRLKKR